MKIIKIVVFSLKNLIAYFMFLFAMSFGVVYAESILDLSTASSQISAYNDMNLNNANVASSLPINVLHQDEILTSASSIPIAIEKNGWAVSKSRVLPDQHILTQAEIQKELEVMKAKMNARIERWGESLTRKDFRHVRGTFQLNESKQVEVCQIFQNVINETFQLAQVNKHRLTFVDQKILSNRKAFIKALGFENNIVRTQLGFDCLML